MNVNIEFHETKLRNLSVIQKLFKNGTINYLLKNIKREGFENYTQP